MPNYEMLLVLRQMAKPELAAALKRTAEAIFEKGGLLRKLENLGSRPLPYKVSAEGQVHRHASYFLMEFDVAPHLIFDLQEETGRDVDIIRRRFFSTEEQPKYPCTLEEECLPPAYRKEVQNMIDMGKRKQRKRFQYNSGFDYYPFQK